MFHTDMSKSDGLSSYCKTCKKDRIRTRWGLKERLYAGMKSNSKNRGHDVPMKEMEFIKWVTEQDNFESLYQDWKNSGYDKMLSPSIDRLDDNVGYTLTNIRLTTWKDNDEKQRVKTRKPVEQYDLRTGKIIAIFESRAKAEEETGTKGINGATSGRRKSAGGFGWRHHCPVK